MEINRKRVARRLVSGLVAGALALGGLAISGGSVSAKTPVTTLKRVQGTDRYSTATAIASSYIASTGNQSAWRSSGRNLILASGESYADALAASSLAKRLNAPILLTKADSVPASVRDWLLLNRGELADATIGKVYVVGGTSVISDATVTAFMADLNGATDASPHTSVRVAGDNRYATAAAIAGVSGVYDATDWLIIANGTSYADSMSASVLSYNQEWPIILTDGGSTLRPEAAAIVATHVATTTLASQPSNVLIIGGTSAIPKSVEEQLVLAGVEYREIVRIAGADRYATNTALNKDLFKKTYSGSNGRILGAATTFNGANVALATGTNFPDALAAAPLLGHLNAMMVLTQGSSLGNDGLFAQLSVTKLPTNLWAIGGESAVPATVLSAGVSSAQQTNITTSLVGCVTGAGATGQSIYMSMSPIPDADNSYILSDTEVTKILAALTVDGVAATATIGTANGGTGAALDTDLDEDGTNESIKFTLSARLTAGQTLAFTGVNEATGGNSRSFAATSCGPTGVDTTKPVLTVVTKHSATNETQFEITSNEALDPATVLAFVGTGLTVGGTACEADEASAARLSSTSMLVTIAAGAATGCFAAAADAKMSAIAALGTPTIVVDADAVKDLAQNGNDATAGHTVSAATDTTKLVASGQTLLYCLPNQTGVTEALDSGATNGLTMTAVSYLLGGTKDGAAGNGYKLLVTNQRGLTIPMIAIDDVAKTVTVTADTGYHNADDVIAASKNHPVTGDWYFTKTGTGALTTNTALTAKTIGLTSSQAGRDGCVVSISSDELLGTQVAMTNLVVNGVAVSAPTPAPSTSKRKANISFNASSVVTGGSIAMAGTLVDLQGNSTAFAFSL